MTARIVVVDDDESLRRVTALALSDANTEVREVPDGLRALELIRSFPPDCVVADLKMPGMDGLELLQRVKHESPDVPFVLMTAHGTVDTAVSALKLGAYDYLTKPVAKLDLRRLVARAIEHGRLRSENRRLRGVVAGQLRPLGQSRAWTEVIQTIERVATSEATILLTGESGTGKEVLARHIHGCSERNDGPFVAINCAALPPSLLESELFGHTKGAFTGADRARSGRFQQADGGTLLLDEVGELPLELQAKLLRALQEREVDPIGAQRPVKVDVRLVAATNAELRQRVDEGAFRADLYYRLAVLPIRVPPLRERPGDAPVLFAHFLAEFAGEPVRIEAEAADLLEASPWPGNVRELRNVAERCWLLGIGERLDAGALHRALHFGTEAPAGHLDGPALAAGPRPSVLNPEAILLPPESLPLEDLERAVVVAALRRFKGNKSAAARYLQVPRHVLIYRLEKFDIGAHEIDPDAP
jgi:two-component system NtrC family response regulator